ncbi:MAG: hypothetical protein D6815_07005 [Candidatus Dadabacteria bacterium]|nr:MAG: hypothetical protein D6815_07005 [Candidatus Dadabacteria bacterium]
MGMRTRWSGALALAALFLAAGTSARAAQTPVAVACSLQLKYAVLAERPTAEVLGRYTCEGKVIAASDVDATSVDRRQVVFSLDACLGLPPMVVFGRDGVTEVRKLAGPRVRGHAFSGECKGCAIAPNAQPSAPVFDAGHFDATFVVKPLAAETPDAIILPSGKGRISLRSERTDEVIARGRFRAKRCTLVPPPPIFCGGIAGLPCPDGMTCVDYPDDDCDPAAGGADCIGICVSP